MMFSKRMLLVAVVALAACQFAAAQSWEDCKTTSMVLTNGYRFRNLDVTAYSRLGNNATTLECLNKCRADQECYSFNYDKVKKWCYLSLSEKTELTSARDAKFAAGYRKCIAHSGNGAWENPAFNGGQEGTAPDAPLSVAVSKFNSTTNKVVVDWDASLAPGTLDGTNYAAIASYTVSCSGIVSFTATVAADAITYTYGVEFAATGPASCTVTATNTANLSATSAVATASLTKS